MPVPLLVMLAAGQLAGASPSAACTRAAAVAERRWGLPDHLLLAIGRVESGWPDPATGQAQPWPWSADAAGQDYVFRSAAEAATVVGYLQHYGVASIDVGCFQVNLHYHPDAFRSRGAGIRPAGQRRLRRPLPAPAVRAQRRLGTRDRRLPLRRPGAGRSATGQGDAGLDRGRWPIELD